MSNPMTAKQSLAPRLALLLGVLVVVGLLVWLAVAKLGKEDDRVTLTAVFADSSPLTTGNQVRMNGVMIGTISGIALVDGKAQVTMKVDPSILPLHTDASARIEPVSLLGERFVAILPGTETGPALDPPAIDLKHTSAAVDLDQLLNTLDDPTSTALAAMVTTLGQGLDHNGDQAARALRGLAPTLQDADKLSRLLDQQNQLLDHFVVQVQRTVDQVAPPVDSLVDGATEALGAVAVQRQALNDTLVQAPSTLASARSTLAQLSGTASNTTDVLHGIRPTTDHLRDVGNELQGFSRAAIPALESLPDVLDRLNRMLDEARPVVSDLKPLARDLSSVSDSVHAIGHQVMKHPRGQASQLEHLMSALPEWGMSVRDYDGVSQIFHAELNLAPNTFAQMATGALPPVGNGTLFNPIQRDPRGQSGPNGGPALPDLPAAPDLDPRPGPKGGDPRTYYGPRGNHSGDASGMTPQQEGSLFDGMLGGGK